MIRFYFHPTPTPAKIILRAAARLSLGSASSDIEPIERLLSYKLHDRANCLPPQGGFRRPGRDYCTADCP